MIYFQIFTTFRYKSLKNSEILVPIHYPYPRDSIAWFYNFIICVIFLLIFIICGADL